VRRIPEGHAVEERFRILLAVLQRPGLARIGRLVNPRLIPVADRHQISGLGVDRMDVAEVEFIAAWNRSRLPRLASVRRSDKCPTGAAGPDYVGIDDAQTEQVGSGVRLLGIPLPERGRRHKTSQKNRDFHGRQRPRKTSAKHALLLLPQARGRSTTRYVDRRSGAAKVINAASGGEADEARLTPEARGGGAQIDPLGVSRRPPFRF